MKEQLKDMARPYAMLFLIALAVAIVGRIGLAVMDLTGTLSYDYISAADVPILDVVCSILTGSALVAFMYAASLAMVVSTAGVALHGLLFARRSEGAGRPATAFLWGWATALAAIVCLLITASGILSAVQVASMSSKLPSLPMLVLALVGFAAFLGTLLGAASMTVCACLARAGTWCSRLSSAVSWSWFSPWARSRPSMQRRSTWRPWARGSPPTWS